MGHDQDFVEKLTEASKEAKEVLHDMYAAMKDARKVVKALDQAIENLAEKHVGNIIAVKVDEKMETFTTELLETQRQAANKVTDQFEKMFTKFSSLLMDGEAKEKIAIIEHERAEVARLTKELEEDK